MFTIKFLNVQGLLIIMISAMLIPFPARSDNTQPIVTAHFAGNQTFLRADKALPYQIIASDKEDGDTIAGTIDKSKIAVGLTYMEYGYESFIPDEVDTTERIDYNRGKTLISNSDCVLCHTESSPSVIPNYKTIALAYQNRNDIVSKLAQKIIDGGAGVWGSAPMSPHPALSQTDAVNMVQYILSLAKDPGTLEWLPLRGSLQLSANSIKTEGRYVFWATYTDKGINNQNKLTGYTVKQFRGPIVPVTENDMQENMHEFVTKNNIKVLVAEKNKAYLAFHSLDLTGIDYLKFYLLNSNELFSGGKIEVRLQQPYGRLVGSMLTEMDSQLLKQEEIVLPIKPVSGLQDLFLVILGDPENNTDILALSAIEFMW